MLQQAAHEVADEIDPQRPARAEVAKDAHHVRNTGERHATIGHGLGKVDGFTVAKEVDAAEYAQVEPGRGDEDVGFDFLA